MELIFEPAAPWHWIATALAAVIGLWMLVALAMPTWRSALGRRAPTSALAALLSLGAGALLAAAAFNPLYVRRPDPQHFHLAVVLDVSQSVQHTRQGWPKLREEIAALLSERIAVLEPDIRRDSSAGIVLFGQGAVKDQTSPDSLEALPGRIKNIDTGTIADAGSDIASGLRAAGDSIEQHGGRGVAVLISDGYETQGDALAEAKRLAGQGIPIFVYPVESRGGDLALLSTNLPRQVNTGEETTLRGVIWNGRADPADINLSIARNPGLAQGSVRVSAQAQVESPQSQSLPANEFARLREPVVFTGYGLQYADLKLAFDAGRGEQRRRLFTHVRRPLTVLAIGGDQRWIGALPQTTANVTEIQPDELDQATDLRTYDAVVISAVYAREFPPAALTSIATAVEQDGVGLMLLNGDHAGNSPEAETMLKSYDGTPLQDLLPIENGPRPFEAEPPHRHIIFLIDTSGSMSGWPLDKAKEIVAYIIENLMRPVDTVDIIGFTTGAAPLVEDQAMTPSGKLSAIAALNTLSANGGTAPEAALALVADKQFDECGLIFLSDGGFNPVDQRPDCRTTVFAVNGNIAPDSPLRALADPFAVDQNFAPASITIPYFNPEKRTRNWEVGPFTALRFASATRSRSDLPVPDLPWPGNAITHAREGAEIVAVRPKLRDPLLAYRQSGTGYVGVMTSAVTPDLLEREDGRAAIERWVREVAPYAANDRYDFQLEDLGDRMTLRIAIIPQGRLVPDVRQLTVRIERAGQLLATVGMQPDPSALAVFTGQIQLDRDTQAAELTMIVAEIGPEALIRPQRIPFILPPKGVLSQTVGAESYSYGTNNALLDPIVNAGGGRWLDLAARVPIFQANQQRRESRSLWQGLVLAAGLLYLVVIAIRRFGL
jgi:Mg-chelatase subunit ChlD